MNQQKISLVLAFVLVACGDVESYGIAPLPDAATAPDSATPPPPAMEDAGPAAPETECEEGEIRDEVCNDACGEGNSFRLCVGGSLRCRVRDVSLCPGGEPPVEEEDAGTPPVVTDAGTPPPPPPPPPPPAMEDAGTPPPVDLCAGSPDEVCVEACVGAGLRRCDPETGEYGECDIVVVTPCTDAGTPPPPPADAGPTCTPTTEVCDGIDNNCDGAVDEVVPGTPLTEDCYGGSAGTEDVAECRSGTRFCAAGTWSACFGQVVPRTETCGNGLDEDCNGSDLACASSPCSDPRISTACSNGRAFTCRRDGIFVCSGGVVSCNAPDVVPTSEVCGNSIDEDCNGSDLVCTPPTGGLDRFEFTLDNAAIDRDLGTCRNGAGENVREVLFWDYLGTPHAGNSTLPFVYEADEFDGGYRAVSFRCGGSYATWPMSEIGQVAIHNGWIDSIRVNGVELADSETLICRDPVGGHIRPMLPRSSGEYGRCP